MLAQTTSRSGTIKHFLWHIGGGNPEILPGCPQLERAKFLLLALLNLILAIATGTIVAWASNVFLTHVYLAQKMLISSTVVTAASAFVGIVSLPVALLLLASAVRTYHVAKAQSIPPKSMVAAAANMYARTLRIASVLLPGVLIAILVAIALRLATADLGPMGLMYDVRLYDVIISYGLATLVGIFASPVVLAMNWPSPVYQRLLRDPPQAAIAGSDTASTDEPAQRSSAPPGAHTLVNEEHELRALFEQYPDSRQLADRLIGVQRSLGLLDRAVRVYDILIERNPRDAELLRRKAQLYREIGQEDRYLSIQSEADRVQASLSFEDNLGKAINARLDAACQPEPPRNPHP